jgi:hypothetical protein
MKTEKVSFLKRVGKGSCEHIKVLTSPCEKTDCHKTTKDLICAVEEGKPWQHSTGGIKIGTLILGSASK